MIDPLSAYELANSLAAIGAIGGAWGFYHLQFHSDDPASLRHTVPLLCSTAILTLLALGIWFSGPVTAALVRVAIAVLAIIIEVAVANPLCLARRLTRQ